MRTLKFDVITDSRFHSEPEIRRDYIVGKILNDLNNLPGVIAVPKDPRTLMFDGDQKGDPKTKSCRVTIYVQKKTRRLTWDDIYGVINATRPAPYSFVNMTPLG